MRRLIRFLAGLGLVAGALLAGLEIYTRTPDDFDIQPLALPAGTRSAILIFHGSEDGDDPVLADIAARLRQALPDEVAVRNYRWAPASDNRLRAAANARVLGTILGRELAELGSLSRLRLIAHSAGAFVPDALCYALRQQSKAAPWIEMTFLDPFGIDGFVDWNYGARHHGECADFALAIINRDDPAPATNALLRQACNIDITGLPGSQRLQRNGHYWPLQFFLDSIDEFSRGPDSQRRQSDCTRGMVLDSEPQWFGSERAKAPTGLPRRLTQLQALESAGSSRAARRASRPGGL